MKKILASLLVVVCSQILHAENPATVLLDRRKESAVLKEEIATFTFPTGWMIADQNKVELPPLVKMMVVGKSSTFPPSINLTTAPYEGKLKEYLQIVKARNAHNHHDWKDLGMIQTRAGKSSLSQVDSKSQWGDVRQMHVIHLKNGIIYILTVAALKSDFSLYYQDFLKSMRSFRISSDLLSMIDNPKQKEQLQSQIKNIHTQWQLQLSSKQANDTIKLSEEDKEKLFNSEPFKSKVWMSFKDFLGKNYMDLGPEWLNLMQQRIKNELFNL